MVIGKPYMPRYPARSESMTPSPPISWPVSGRWGSRRHEDRTCQIRRVLLRRQAGGGDGGADRRSKKAMCYAGSIIHNRDVVDHLAAQGLYAVQRPEDVPEGCAVIIRSHGVPERICRKIQEQGLCLVDATCPFVKKIHNIVKKKSGEGFQIVIIAAPPTRRWRGSEGGPARR